MILEEYDFTYKGKEVHISIEENPYVFKISFNNRGLKEEIIYKAMTPNFIAKTIICEYFVRRVNNIDGKVENSRQGTFTVTPEEFDQFFTTPTGEMHLGVFLARNFVNGMTFEEKETLGVRFFNSELTPTQPVHFDVTVIGDTIDAQVTDGIAPFSFQIDDSEPQEEGTFEDVTLGDHIIKVTDANGTYLEKQVTV